MYINVVNISNLQVRDPRNRIRLSNLKITLAFCCLPLLRLGTLKHLKPRETDTQTSI